MAKPKIKKNAVVLTARDLLKGYVADKNDSNIYNMSPLQMIPAEEKDDDWKKWNMDWLERVGMRQLSYDALRMIKNYNIANGIIDTNDYVIDSQETNNIVGTMVHDGSANKLPIRFFPIVPNIVNVMVNEFAKRDNRIIAYAVDMYSHLEAEEAKKEMLTNILVQKAEQDKLVSLAAMGLQGNSPEVQKMIQQELETTKQLTELGTKFKGYRTIPEQWANHVIQSDTERFNMYQNEVIGFRDLLITDREFWHIRVTDDDYSIELWNPIHTFHHKSPDVQYISEGNYVGRIRMMSVPDVIDMFGDQMTEEQLLELKNGYKIITNLPLVPDAYRDRLDMYSNYGKPYPNSITNVTWGQFMDGNFMKKMQDQNSRVAGSNNNFDFSWFDLNKMPTDYMTAMDTPGMVRVTEAYWKSQRRVGKLTRIMDTGEVITQIVDENYEVTIEPIYDKSIEQKEKADNLVFGEHIEWTWINEVRKGIKINSALSTYYTRNYSTFEPIYIGGDPIPFQFKGQDQLYGARLPVEGLISSERNSYSSSLVDKTKNYQMMFNVFNNQVLEYVADDVGMVIVLDQGMIPRNSMGGEWGKYNFPMLYQVMKDYQIVALDTNPRNSDGPTNFQHFQQVDMSKTTQILTRLKLAEWAKQSAYEVVGITPQRLGEVAASESATGVRQAVNNSYAQTETYFDVHMNHLMPRVRQMALDAAQFITSTKPESRIAYQNTNEEKEWFNIEGYKLLLRDFRVHAKSTANIKEMVENLRRLAMENNTSGGSLYDLSQMMTLQSPAEIISKLAEADAKRQQEVEAQRQHEIELQQMQQKVLEDEAKRQDYWKGKEMEKDILVAQIRATQSKTNDVNTNSIPDPLEAADFLETQKVNATELLDLQRRTDLEEQKHEDSMLLAQKEMDLEREKLASKERIEALKARTALKNKTAGEGKRKK